MVPRAQASADRINEVLDEEEEIVDDKAPKMIQLKGDQATLAFDHVNYRYHGAEKLALQDIDFQAKSGDFCGNHWWYGFWEDDIGQFAASAL